MKLCSLFFLICASVYAFAGDITIAPIEVSDTTLLKAASPKKGTKASVAFLKFQAEERKAFYDDLATERSKLLKEFAGRRQEVLDRQRQSRREFDPEKHSIEERRQFFTSQRDEMLKLKVESKEGERHLKREQKRQCDEMHARQKRERREFLAPLQIKASPSPQSEAPSASP